MRQSCKITLLTGISSALGRAAGPRAEETTPASTGVVGVWMVGVGSPAADDGVIAKGTLAMKLSLPNSSAGSPSTRVPEVARVWEREDLGGDIM